MSTFSRPSTLVRFLLAIAVVVPFASSSVNAATVDTEATSVIVQKAPGSGTAPEDYVKSVGGEIVYDLSIINGFAAKLDESQLAGLKVTPGVRFVTEDAPVRMNEEVVPPATDPAPVVTEPAPAAPVAALTDPLVTVTEPVAAVVEEPLPTEIVAPEEDVTTLTADVSSDEGATLVTNQNVNEGAVDPVIPESQSVAAQPSEEAPSDVSVYQKEIGADKAHLAGAKGAGVTVALIDTGVSPVADLSGKVVSLKNPNNTYKKCVNLSGETGCGDSYGHGTFIAGLIAGNGSASNGKYAGVAPDAKILSVKIAGKDGSASVGKIIFAIQWVAQHKSQYNIKVMNLSLGTDSTQSYKLDPLNYAVEYAWGKGISVVVSAGNRGPGNGTISKPADDPLVITTGAVDDLKTAAVSDDILPDFSSKGPTAADGLTKPDITAPGAHLIGLRSPNSAIEQEYPGGGVDSTYRRGSGTSQSAGVVSGSVALLLSKHPTLTPNQVKYALMHSAQASASSDPNAVGAGLLNIGAAVTNLPVGSANQGVVLGSGDGSIAGSQGKVKVVLEDGSGVLGIVGGVIPVKGSDSADPSGGSWYGTSWYGGSWYGGSWYGGSWYGTPAGGSWYGGSWYGGSWYGGSWYGGSWYGGSWYGAWD